MKNKAKIPVKCKFLMKLSKSSPIKMGNDLKGNKILRKVLYQNFLFFFSQQKWNVKAFATNFAEIK